ncbi:MAG: hypothetical protein CTY19_11070 [Methylomonas sp.]|nr:MAG: hypothetical protein CTY19_11070 [Methylomonas sp.]
MTNKPCIHEYLASSDSGKVLICRDCGVVHLQLQNLSMRFEAEQFAALADMMTVASKKMLQQTQTTSATRSEITLVH